MGAINAVTDLSVEDGIAIITINNPPVNALGHAVREGIVQAMQKADADPAVKAVVLICEGRTFHAGADITEFGKPPVAPWLPEVVVDNRECAQADGRRDSRHCAWRRSRSRVGLSLSRRCFFREVRFARSSSRLVAGRGRHRSVCLASSVLEKRLRWSASGAHIDAKTANAAGLIDEIVCPKARCAPARSPSRRRSSPRIARCKKVRDLNDKVEAARGKPNSSLTSARPTLASSVASSLPNTTSAPSRRR